MNKLYLIFLCVISTNLLAQDELMLDDVTMDVVDDIEFPDHRFFPPGRNIIIDYMLENGDITAEDLQGLKGEFKADMERLRVAYESKDFEAIKAIHEEMAAMRRERKQAFKAYIEENEELQTLLENMREEYMARHREMFGGHSMPGMFFAGRGSHFSGREPQEIPQGSPALPGGAQGEHTGSSFEPSEIMPTFEPPVYGRGSTPPVDTALEPPTAPSAAMPGFGSESHSEMMETFQRQMEEHKEKMEEHRRRMEEFIREMEEKKKEAEEEDEDA
ncbi:hypothetical protein [Teredinibacter haidensis]|uniref:hypothetical protein n=1 Tax=Teredinibacter haidensis TaxID=2731755 RepID=UPI000948AA5F|nr:hypothetical protein [Teredinibacter haidensis]